MSNKIIIILLITFIFFGCKKDMTHALSSENFSEEYHGNCNRPDCAQVTIDYIKIKGKNEIVNRINFTIRNAIIYFLNANFEKNIRATTISEASKFFIKNYESDKEEFPEISPYFAEVSVSQSFSSEKILSVKMQYYFFTGGAHGNGATTFINFNPTTGEIFTNKSLMKNKKEFTDFVEDLFRKKHHISPNESINSTGFWFENDTFALPDAIGFTDTALIIIYNQYEIASYADGPIELTIPMANAAPYLVL